MIEKKQFMKMLKAAFECEKREQAAKVSRQVFGARYHWSAGQ